MHQRLVLLVMVFAVVLVGPAGAVVKPKVTVIGDSVADKIRPNAALVAELGDGFRLNLQTRGCRATVIPGCTVAGQGAPPPTVLDVVNKFGRWLGRVVVIETGYNDNPAQYGADVDAVMAALKYWHVKTVVWLTLHDPRPDYQGMNTVIGAAGKRWPQMVVADWGRYAAGHDDWFAADGIHPTSNGAANLAVFIHAAVVQALAAH